MPTKPVSNEDRHEQDDWIKITVKLLFKKIADGKAILDPDRVPEATKALREVKFDQNGDPLLETVSGVVRSIANMVGIKELEALEKEAEERERNSPVHEFLPPPVGIAEEALRECAEKGDFLRLAFELYKETGAVLAVCAHSYSAQGEEEYSLPRNQAICAGLLIRITKFMVAVLELSARANRGEVVSALNRSIFESAANLRFLLLKDEPKIYDEFVRASLGPERELYDVIQKNIAERGGQVLPIEERMHRSIDRVFGMAGIKIEDVSSKAKGWAGNLRGRLRALGDEELYLTFQRIPSHAVHGTWVDLAFHDIEEKNNGFVAKPRWSPVDARHLGPTALVVLRAAEAHMRHFFGELPELRPLYTRMSDLATGILKVDDAHEEWLSKRRRDPPPERHAEP